MSYLSESVDELLALAADPEAAHAAEDALMRDYIRNHSDPADLEEFERLWSAEFPRWSA